MANVEIVEYIKDQLDAGYSEAEIREALQAEGWSSRDVEEAFDEVYATAQKNQSRPPPPLEPVEKATPAKADLAPPPAGLPARSVGKGGFILSMVGGLLALVALGGGMAAGTAFNPLAIATALFGILMILGSLLIRRGTIRGGALLVMIPGVIGIGLNIIYQLESVAVFQSLVPGPINLDTIGYVVGLVGGIMGVRSI